MYSIRIISGGQTGVDRGALDAALEAGASCGGWCPAGRLAEDGVIEDRYPLSELPGAGYAQRTLANVRDSDATLVVSFGPPEGGTGLTIEHARELGRSLLVIDATATPLEDAAARVLAWLAQETIQRLNVAGPRASRERRAHAYARELLRRVLAGLESPQTRSQRV